MSVLADFQYTLSDFNRIKECYTVPELDIFTIKNINKIASKVGAPNYIKTPIFKKNRNIHKKKEDWNISKNFKQTELHKHETGVEVQFDKIRSYLNKLTEKNYSEQYDNILCITKNIEGFDETNLEKIGNSIFEIGSKNKFWSVLYARLYYDIIKEYPIMKDICINKFKSFNNLFKNINYIDAQEDYNLFCEYNKENENRKSLSKFLVLCSNYNIIDKNEIIDIILNFFDNINELITIENKYNHVDEIVQNIKIIICNFDKNYKLLNKYNIIEEKIKLLSNLKPKDYSSLNNKILFNILDICDIL